MGVHTAIPATAEILPTKGAAVQYAVQLLERTQHVRPFELLIMHR